MTQFIQLAGTVVRCDHVSAVGPASKTSSESPEGYFCVYLVGDGAQNPLFVYGRGKQLVASRNKLLRAMGAVI